MSEIEISVAELQRRQKPETNSCWWCARTMEYDACRIEGAKLIPMRTIPANLQALDCDEDVICYCHHGQRSLDVAAWLRSQGVESAQSLAGGMIAGPSKSIPTFPATKSNDYLAPAIYRRAACRKQR